MAEDSSICDRCSGPLADGEANTCSACRQLMLAEEETITPQPADSEAATLVPDQSAARTTSDTQQVGDYDLLGEVARGGMGVVYRAKHRDLNRLAAVKMVLGGGFSNPQELQRFKVEAESAAKLDHPAIVPIYEIGEHDGQPFFAMKLIDGGSLAGHSKRLSEDARSAVKVMIDVVEGVHHAHQRGVLHRDLKPANILIDQEGRPFITDLGLAKSTTGDSGLTHTGAVLGTPSYMPPEQASGDAVTTAADIYSLGAILYELLVGRPPYQGESAVSVLVQVVEGAPAQPSAVKATVDRDLELICLKCMERKPSERYSSAQDLADDLKSWLAGEPISIRPPTMRAIVANWFKQNQRLVYLMFATLAGFVICAPVVVSFFSDEVSAVYSRFPDQQKPLVFSVVFPAWLSTIASLVLLVFWPSIGLLNTILAKPKTFRQALLAGGLVAFSVSLVAFCLLGWLIFLQSADNINNRPIEVLSSAVWPETVGDNEEALRAANALYGGLEEIPQSERASLIVQRLRADHFASVSWAYLVMSIVLTVLSLPIIYGTAIAFILQGRSQPIWLLLSRYAVAWWAAIAFLVGVVRLLLILVLPAENRRMGAPYISLSIDTLIGLAIIAIIIWATLKRWRKVPTANSL